MSKNNNKALRISQNFLTSAAVLNRIIRLSGISKNDHVVEIGAGKGHITKLLGQRCGRVSAIEYDKRLCKILNDKFETTENVRVINFDFLKWSLPKGNYKIFANIPFCITSKIIRKITQAENPPQEAWLVVEKGAAKRFAGKPTETLNSLLLKPCFELSIIYHFRREDFHPMPGADAVLLHLKKKAVPDIDPRQMREYSRFISDCFGNQRAGMKKYLTKRQITKALKCESLSTDITSRETLYIQCLCLFRCYCRFKF